MEVENLDCGGIPAADSGRFGVGIIALRDREEEDESSGSPEMFNRETFMFQDGITLRYYMGHILPSSNMGNTVPFDKYANREV